jgi:uncharacterized membrane protein YdbT with pleckstrin-like domain
MEGFAMTKDTQTIMNETFNDEIRFQERKRLLFFGLPWTFTVYTLTDSVLTIDTGLLNTVENDCYMYKIQDVKLSQSLMEKIFNIGTVTCYTGDTTDAIFSLVHVRNYRDIKTFILKASEASRIKRRTLNVQDISASDLSELDGIDN